MAMTALAFCGYKHKKTHFGCGLDKMMPIGHPSFS
jgi:hypothetical protein